MYTGTLISDLMTTVELVELGAEQRAERKRLADERELTRIYALQVPVTQSDRVLMGAA